MTLQRRTAGALAIVGLLGFLPAFTDVKLGALQPEDFVLLFLLGFCICKFIYSGFSFRISAELSGLLRAYGLLLLALLALSVIALRLTFYPLDDVSFLKQPVIFSFSKILQFAAVICGFLWLTNAFIKHRNLLASAMNAYWLAGVVSCWYALLSWFALSFFHFTTPENFGAYLTPEGPVRARGFFNEGGPFGLYVVSILVVGLLRRRLSGRRLGVANTTIVSIAFLLSRSKAGLLAAALLGFYLVISAASFKKCVLYFALTTAILWGTAAWLDLGNQLVGYLVSYQNVDDEVAANGDKGYNLVVGRVSGLYIIPRMIASHPLTGIGYGNYPLMRNDPLYLGTLPAITEVEDLAGLGIPGIAAEMGIPITLWLLVLLFTPYRMSRRKSSVLGAAAIFQPFAHVFAVQLTFFYPWFVSACALAASYYEP
jgi:hypothetical protein